MLNYNKFKRAFTLALVLVCAHIVGAQELQKVANWDKTTGFIQMKSNTKIEPLSFFPRFGKELGLTEKDEMVLLREEKDNMGVTHFRFQQKHLGIGVEHAVMIVHAKEGRVVSVNGEIEANFHTNTDLTYSKQDALALATEHLGDKQYVWEVAIDSNRDKLGLEHLDFHSKKPDVKTAFIKNDNGIVLVYVLDIFFVEDSKRINGFKVYIDVNTKKVIKKNPLVHTCSQQIASINHPYYSFSGMSVKTNYESWCVSGHNWFDIWCLCWRWTCDVYASRYNLHDNCQGTEFKTYDNAGYLVNNGTNNGGNWGTNQQIHTMPHWAVKKTYDYFSSSHGLYGTGNSNSNLIQIQAQQGLFNAYATSNGTNDLLVFGYNSNFALSTLDIAGHEYTHRVTEHGPGLVYQNESGALNESFSDIFGAMTEFSQFGANANYQIGENLYYGNPTDPLRDMANPNTFGQPDTYMGQNWYTGSNDNGGVHTNSGVQNYWFYLLAEGGSGTNDNGDTYCVSGLGKYAAANIAFHTLKYTISDSNCTYAQVRNFSIIAATSIYGPNSTQVQQVIKAWYAVGVGPNPISLIANAISACPMTAATLTGTITTGIAPYTVTLYNTNNAIIATTNTNNANYSFSILPSNPFDYYVIAVDAMGNNIYMGGCPVHIDIANNTFIGINAYSMGATNCLNDDMQIEPQIVGNLNALSYLWNIGGQSYTTQTVQANLSAGNYPISLTVTTANGCTTTVTNNVLVAPDYCGYPYFYPTINGNLVTLNAADFLSSGEWSVLGNNGQLIGTYSEGTTSISLVGGNYTICHTKFNCDGTFCSNDCQSISTCDPLQLNITGNTDICSGTSTTLTANVTGSNNPYTYSWSSGQTTSSITVNPTIPKTYTVMVSAPNACSATSSANVTINPLPATPTLTGGPFCSGANTALTANTGTSTPYTYSWIGTSSAAATATGNTFIPTASGNHRVIITDANGCKSSSAWFSVIMSSLPNANAGVDKSVCVNSGTTIGATASAGASYLWSPSTGLSNATISNPTVTPTTAGVSTYNLTVTNAAGCSKTDAVDVTGIPLPSTPTLNSTPSPVCQGTNIVLTPSGTSGITSWYKNGVLHSSGTSPAAKTFTAVTPVTGDTFKISTKVGNCTSNYSNIAVVTINAKPSLAISAASTGATTCSGDNMNITATVNGGQGPYTYLWTIAGQTYTSASVQAALAMGTYTASLTVTTANGCTSSISSPIVVAPVVCGNPSFSAVVTNSNVITFNAIDNTSAGEWTISNTNTGQVFTYPNGTQSATLSGGSYQICHKMKNCQGAVCNSTCQNVTLCSPLQLTITGNLAICAGTSTTLTANVTGGSGNYSYLWSNGQTTNSITVNPTAAKTYTVSVSAPNACTVTANVTVTVNPLPTAPSITGGPFFCVGGSAVLTANTGTGLPYTYSWIGTSPSASAATGSIFVPTAAGNHRVIITDANGCSQTSAWFGVTMSPLPNANAGADKNICVNSSATLGVTPTSGGFSYQWSPSTDLSNTTISNPTVTPLAAGLTSYTLTVTNTTTGCVKTDIVEVTGIALPPTPTISSTPSPVCQGTAITLTPSATTGTVNWYKNGSLNSTVNSAAPKVLTATTTSPDVYTITTKVGACISDLSNTANVMIHATPTPTITASPTAVSNIVSICNPGMTSGTAVLSATIPANAPSVLTYNWLQVSGGSSTNVGTSSSYNASVASTPTTQNNKVFRLDVSYTGNCTKSSSNITVKMLPPNCTPSRTTDEELEIDAFATYPNPTSGTLSISIISPKSSKGKLTLTNMLGQVVIEKEISLTKGKMQTDWDLSALASGMYSLTFSHEKGQEVKKIVKE